MNRTIKLAIAATSALALLAPSSALAGRSHHLKLYKVEMHVDLEGQDDTYTVECRNNDLALDGMWRIDDVEQDNDYTWVPSTGNPQFDVRRAVRPVQVRNNGDSAYDFKFTPESGGDVSMKLFVTCLGEKTESVNGHTHKFTITGGGTDTVVVGTLTQQYADSTSASCGVNQVVVQPSFDVTGGDADLVTSRPITKLARDWEWQWVTATPGFAATHTWRCLNMRSNTELPASSNPHRHRIVKQFKTNDPAQPYNAHLVNDASSPSMVKKNSIAEVQLHCGEHYKGLVGGWHVGPGTPHDDADGPGGAAGVPYSLPNPGYGYLWFLGMDPRIKTRAFRFINAHLVNDYRADLYLVCFKDRTT